MSTLYVDNLQPNLGSQVAIPNLKPLAGSVVSVHNAISSAAHAINSAGLVNVTGLSITFTPKSANNLIVMEAVIQNTRTYVTSYAFLKNGALTAPATNSNNTSVTNSQLTLYKALGTADLSQTHATPLMHYEVAGDTNSRTYTVACTSSWGSSGYTMYVNNRSNNDMGAYSYFRIMEIAQ